MSQLGPLGYVLPAPDLDERLDVLIGECAEVIQAAIKCKRFGMESHHPEGGPTNREMLEEELGHVQSALTLMHLAGDVLKSQVARHEGEKLLTIQKWMTRQK